MSVGILEADKIISATAAALATRVHRGVGDRQRRHQGASFASKDITEKAPTTCLRCRWAIRSKKSCSRSHLELSKTTAVVGMQDMGAAGITCSTSEMSAAGSGHGHCLDRVPSVSKTWSR